MWVGLDTNFFFNKYAGTFFGDLQFEKKFTELPSLEILEKLEKVLL